MLFMRSRTSLAKRVLHFESLECRLSLNGDPGPSLPEGTTASLVADHVGNIQPGTIVSFQASNTADIPTETAFRLRSGGGEWTTARPYDVDGFWAWNTSGLEPDIYYVGTFVRAVGASQAYQVAATPLKFVLSNAAPATGGTIQASGTTVTVGDAVEFTATGQGGTGEYEFKFVGRNSAGEWQTFRDYDTELSWTWDTSEVAIGTYYVGVYIRTAGSNTVFDFAATPVSVEIGQAAPLTSLGMSASTLGPIVAGTPVNFEALPVGGDAIESYEFEYVMRARSSTDWQVVRTYDPSPNWTLDTTEFFDDDYYIGVRARRIGSVAVYEWAATPLTLKVIGAALENANPGLSTSSILVATCDSSAAARQHALFVGDCLNDQVEINAAIQALPPAGGIVRLAEGTYDIRAIAQSLGGVIIDRSNVILEGSGTSSRLVLANNQNSNVVRIIGDGLENITVRDLYINGNFENNQTFDFEGNGIRADSNGPNPLHSITVEDTFIEDSARLNIFIRAANARIVDNRLGDSGSDSVEILLGPGFIIGNYFEIDQETGYAISTDQADDVTISDNIVHVLPGGSISQSVIRTWGGRYSHVITDNQVRAEGFVNRMLEVNGYVNIVSGNIFLNYTNTRSRAEVNGASLVNNNIFLNVDVAMKATANWSSSVANNLLMAGSEISYEPDEGITAQLFEFNNVSIP